MLRCLLTVNKPQQHVEEVPVETKKPGSFEIDRSAIEEIKQDDQETELQTLKLSVYDQDTLEKGIIQQVDDVLEHKKREDTKKRLESFIFETSKEISLCQTKLKKNEALLKGLEITSNVEKQKLRIKRNVEDCKKELSALHAKKNHLESKRTKFLEGEEIDLQDILAIDEQKELNTNVHDRKTESEVEKKIRLGEMTPFGNVLGERGKSSRLSNSLTEFEKYLKDQEILSQKYKKSPSKRQQTLQEKNSDDDRSTGGGSGSVEKHETEKIKPKKDVLKKRILHPKKQKKKEKLGTGISEDYSDQKRSPGKLLSECTAMEDSEGSEYLPSEEECSDSEKQAVKPKKLKEVTVTRKRRSQKKCSYSESWDTDDSDWEYSDDESKVKRRKTSKKEIDDGNVEDYYERLQLWEHEKQRRCSTDDTENKVEDTYHEFDDGLKVPYHLWEKLYSYQKVGVQWLWELNQQCCGGILGDEMGLGKTVQVIAFLAGLSVSGLRSRHGSYRGLGPTIIICPTTLMHQWVREFHTWWPPFRVAILHESGSYAGKKETLINGVYSKGGLLITSYTGAVQHKDALIHRNWHYVILDEGHRIRNPDAQVTLAVKQFRTPHRLILSGSPMQNNLKELWSLFDFIFPGKLGTLPVFMSQMAVPITQGGYANASQVQVATAYKCATVLRDTISPYLLRRMKVDVNTHIKLPPKSEQVLFCKLTEEQRTLYQSYIDSGEVERILHGQLKIFMGLIALRKICNHPDLYSGGPKLYKWESADNLPDEERYGYWKKAGKMLVVESLLNIWHKQGHRVLLFTQGRQMLCILENFIIQKGYKYLKLDGVTSVSARQPLINKFNQEKSYFVFLLTTRVGGLGVNLTGADRVIIYDPDWNPATDTQARERAWRIGQQNRVTIYRLITAGTIEEKMYHRQIFKQFLTNKVLKDPRQRRFFKSNDLFELFTLKETDVEGSTETAAIFAGTGSEVKVKHSSSTSDNKAKFTGHLPHKKISTPKPLQPKKKETKSVVFSESKLEHMKKLAQMLSKKIGTMSVTSGTSDSVTNKENTQSKLNECVTKIEVEDKETVNVTQAKAPEDDPVVEFSASDIKVEQGIEVSSDVRSIKQDVDCIETGNTSTVINDVSIAVDPEGTREEKEPNRSSKQLHASTHNTSSSRDKHKKEERHEKREHKKKKHKKHDHKRKRHKSKGMMFEGECVPYLVGQGEYKTETQEEEEDAENVHKEHDDYVLRKLFKKSGIKTAMRHDTIMEEGPPDYALVEGEAKKVAQEAVRALKESRQHCYRADSGIPTWTGQSGAIRFSSKDKNQGYKSNNSDTPSTSGLGHVDYVPKSSKDENRPMSSNDLLSRIHQRNRLLGPPASTSETPAEETAPPEIPTVINENVELLTDIRNFVAFGSSIDGRATTKEIVDHFKDRLPPESTPLFKFLLQEVCKFNRLPSGKGVWKVKQEFKFL